MRPRISSSALGAVAMAVSAFRMATATTTSPASAPATVTTRNCDCTPSRLTWPAWKSRRIRAAPCSACRSYTLVPVTRVYVPAPGQIVDDNTGGDMDTDDNINTEGYWTINRLANCRYFCAGDISFEWFLATTTTTSTVHAPVEQVEQKSLKQSHLRDSRRKRH